MITPAISVLSAVEGLEVATPVLPAVRRAASPSSSSSRSSSCSAAARAASARIFGPVMLRLVRHASRALGVSQIVREPGVLAALNPLLRRALLRRTTAGTASSCSARSSSSSPAARRSTPTWATSARGRSASPGSSSCCPALLLNYFGQGALLLRDPVGGGEPVLPHGPGVGARTRWSCSRPPPPSSPRRRSSPARSRSRSRRCSSATCPRVRDRPHLGARARADLHPGRQLGC